MIKKIIITVLAVALVLVAVVGVVSLISPTDLKVERQATINKPKPEVFAYLKMLKNHRQWAAWQRRDPDMKTEYRGTDGTVGFVSYWKGTGDDTGEGEQEIKKITEGERIDTELRFKQPFESTADAYLVTDAVGDAQTKVRWGFSRSE